VSIVAACLLAAAVALLVAAEWPWISRRTGLDARKLRARKRAKSHRRGVDDG
jgi:hypothetical protein